MAKINVRLPEPKTTYDVSNQKQINRAIQGIVEQLNSTYLQELKEDSERYAWFKGGNNGNCATYLLDRDGEALGYLIILFILKFIHMVLDNSFYDAPFQTLKFGLDQQAFASIPGAYPERIELLDEMQGLLHVLP